MAKKTNSSTDNTSFHGVTFRASVNQIISAFGEPTIQDNTGEDDYAYGVANEGE